jgi:pimeloyl-ACP methyl ester carboxylesterase
MELINTKSFQIAVNAQGLPGADRLALVLPGKLDTKDYAHMRSHVESLASKGFYALSFDPPGTWESPGNISLYTMTNYLKAVDELIEHFGNKPTFVVGHSRGGSIAMLAASRNQYVTHFASIMSFYSFKPEVHGEYPNEQWQKDGYRISMRELPDNPIAKTEVRLPYSFLEDQIKWDMTEDLENCHKPKLFILGTKDELVKPIVVQTAYKIAAAPKELREVEVGHDYRHYPEQVIQVNHFLGEFIEGFFSSGKS